MPEAIDFYFDFSSPYGYLLNEQIDDLAQRHGRQVRRHPILLGVVFQATGSAPLTSQFAGKARYSLNDFARSARFLNLPYRQPSRFPLPTQNAARAFYWLEDRDPEGARRFARAVFRALFVEDRDISSPDVVIAIAGESDLHQDGLAAALQAPAAKERLKAEVDQALERGVFGSPHVIIDGEPFFGADRLPQMERWLATGGF